MLSGKGNLRIREKEKGFESRMLSAIAKLLEGGTGRDLLNDLSRDRGNESQNIVISSQFEKELKGTTTEERAESEAIPLSILNAKTENAHKLKGSTPDNQRTDLPTYGKKGANFSPEEFHDFLVQTDDSSKFKWGDEAYERGAPTGSLVRLVSAPGHLQRGGAEKTSQRPAGDRVGKLLPAAARLGLPTRSRPGTTVKKVGRSPRDDAERLSGPILRAGPHPAGA